MLKKLYFPFVMLVELIILAAFVWFLIYLFPTLDSKGYLFYGGTPYATYLEQYASHTAAVVIRWIFYVVTALMMLFMMVTIIGEIIRWMTKQRKTRHALPDSGEGEQVTFSQLRDACFAVGIDATGVRSQPKQISAIPPPAILHLVRGGKDHFALLLSQREAVVKLYDPNWGRLGELEAADLEREWTGNALLLCKATRR